MKSSARIDADLVTRVAAALLGKIARQQEVLSLNNTELGERTGLNRLTVQRSRAEGADPQLSTVVAMALAVGLTPDVVSTGEDAVQPHEAAVVHRGVAHNRLSRDKSWRDVQRETAFAKNWEGANEYTKVGLLPIMQSLVPNYTQAQATAAATAIQWLGSDVGFAFLTRVLESAGYELLDRQEAGKSKKR